MILVTGAGGSAGGAVVRELAAQGIRRVRAMIRSEKDRGAIPAGIETVQGDFAERASLDRALAGMHAAYLVCSPVQQLVELETNFIAAAESAKLKHLVLNSALGAGDFPKSFPSWHRKVEDRVRAGSVPWTILRPNGFMQNIATYMAPSIRTQDAFYSTIGEARVSLIDVRDVAAVAATALKSTVVIENLFFQDPRDAAAHVARARIPLVGEVFELSGPEAISYDELAERISKVAGRTIRHISLTPEQMRHGMNSAGMPDWQITSLLELDEYYASGKGAASDAALRGLLPSSPRTIDQYLAELGQAAFANP
jgi:uncharacterized protein YbjT (DUF2867 family)